MPACFRRRTLTAVFLVVATSAGCSDTSGPSVAVTLNLYSVDGVLVPVALKTPGGKTVSIGSGRLQGTNRGFACGMSLQLVEGPITAIDVPSCRLLTGEEKMFSAALSDSRFPAGAHTYRFVPR